LINLTKADLKEIHCRVQQRFATTAGINDDGLIDSIVKRPDQILYGLETFPDIYLKAASIMEATIRWHAFTDGNKRTALLATETYLHLNGYVCFYPIHAVRFSVTIALTQGEEQEITNRLIQTTTDWLKKYVANRKDIRKVFQILDDLLNDMDQLKSIYERDQIKAKNIIDEWLAIDIYPEYKKDTHEVLDYFDEIYSGAQKYMMDMMKAEIDELGRMKDEIGRMKDELHKTRPTIDKPSGMKSLINKLGMLKFLKKLPMIKSPIDELDKMKAQIEELDKMKDRINEPDKIEELDKMKDRINKLGEYRSRLMIIEQKLKSFDSYSTIPKKNSKKK
jgi:death on curing protein